MSFANHPLGMPVTYAERLARRHSDVGFIMAQLDREYGPHNVTRAQVEQMRKAVENDNQKRRLAFLVEEQRALQESALEKARRDRDADTARMEDTMRRRAQQEASRMKEAERARRRQIEREAQTRLRLRKHFAVLVDYTDRPERLANMTPRTSAEVIACVAAAFSLKPCALTESDRRFDEVCRARRVAAYVLWKRGSSYAQIGRWMNRDHSTIIHAVRQYQAKATDEMREVAARYLPKGAA